MRNFVINILSKNNVGNIEKMLWKTLNKGFLKPQIKF